jgi:putative integral membrane protein (TIGR02587 family)
VGGALFIGFSIAPTEEVKMLAAELSYWHELALVAISLLVSYLIVFESGFSRQGRQDGDPGPFQRPITETTLSYMASLLVVMGSLYIFGQIKFGDPLANVLSETLVLGLPATVGGAAGRALI